MNYFTPKSVAERFALGRPFFHTIILSRVKAFLSLTAPFSCGLDVGCGTGMSVVALEGMARRIVGLDASEAMIALAPRGKHVDYVVASAERLPFKDRVFDIITLSQVFHWLDRESFLPEARRVLSPHGWLIVYDNYFSGHMVENEEFHTWYTEEYLMNYPSTPRAELNFTTENTLSHGFHLRKVEWLEHPMSFSLSGLVDYLVTQSNVIAVVEGGQEEIEHVRSWLTETLTPMFGDKAEEKISCNAPLWYMQLAA
jgi:SAM-dependent methyltransferase